MPSFFWHKDENKPALGSAAMPALAGSEFAPTRLVNKDGCGSIVVFIRIKGAIPRDIDPSLPIIHGGYAHPGAYVIGWAVVLCFDCLHVLNLRPQLWLARVYNDFNCFYNPHTKRRIPRFHGAKRGHHWRTEGDDLAHSPSIGDH